ncbi:MULTISPECIES: hypothetical protein [Flavobacterium]|uniref:Uncharacterized protein n=1 Tax=Flavobacterium keumense TaxID=1306518 RepID=A0ABY8N697_9FLAO|nr:MULTISPECIES: hypothetical protein [Flavobacterium]WGK93822.1 hypothetical protein MG292_06885 [Flavobacterium keumense]
MKPDIYLKSVLTVIAFCLVINTLKDFEIIPKAYANDSKNNNLPLTPPKNYGLVPVNPDGTIDVNISSISTSDELDVNISEIGDGHVFHGGPIDVRVVK